MANVMPAIFFGHGNPMNAIGRNAYTDAVAYRHALRSSELVTLRWDDVDFTTSRLHVRRAKGGETAVHPISGKELRALRP
jgi:type 1 fimbriae regulatory protein FimB/type 1 fimbriae regulatory protein FimE